MRITTLLSLVLAAGGCVLNVPSVRDSGIAARRHAGCGTAEAEWSSGAASDTAPPAEAVPWPRFHPVPTRPVFEPPFEGL